MKTKTTNGKTVVIATEQDFRSIDRAIDVLCEYVAREPSNEMREVAEAARDGLRDVASSLLAAPQKKPAAPAPDNSPAEC